MRCSSARTRVFSSRVISVPSSTEIARSPAGRNLTEVYTPPAEGWPGFPGPPRTVWGVWGAISGPPTPSERGEGRVRHVGDEHVAGAVRDHERRLRGERDRLRRDAARPEHRHVARPEL